MKRLTLLVLALLLNGCVTLAELKTWYTQDHYGKCYAHTRTAIIFDVPCPPSEFIVSYR